MGRVRPDIGVVGGGIIGMAIALELVRNAARVTLYESGMQAGTGASAAAAGMLAPAYEAVGGEDVHPRLLDLCLYGAGLWREYARKLGCFADFGGSLACARGPDEAEHLERLIAACRVRDIPATDLERAAALAMEPSLGDAVERAVFLPTDGQVDPGAVLEALRRALTEAGVTIMTNTRVTALTRTPDGLMETNAGGRHERIIWAIGHNARHEVRLDGEAVRLAPAGAIFPVKGQMLALERSIHGPNTVIRCGHVYAVPKRGRLLVGATNVRGRDDLDVETETSDAMLADMARIIPALRDHVRLDQWAGIRPGSPDHGPLLGWSAVENIYLAAGHYRNGILLAPASAKFACAAVFGKDSGSLAACFSPDRFG